MNKKIFFVLFFILLLSFASAKSYYLPKAEVYLKIQPDSLIEVEEKITFDFTGKYTFAYRDITKGQWEISNIKVFEGTKELSPEISNYGTYKRIKWFYSAENQQKIFTIKYELKKAVNVYSDVAELNWKVWGENWGVPLNELYGWIEFPEPVKDSNEVYIWGHPEVNGKIGLIENKKILFQVFNIRSNQWIEIRTAFPLELLSSKENAIIKNELGLEKIIEEEKNYGKQPYEAVLFLLLLQLAVFIGVWHFFGREPKIEYDAIYEREIPFDYSPAVVNALRHQWSKTPDLNQITAEILDLCLKGKLKIEEIRKPAFLDKGEYKIHIINRSTQELPSSERTIMGLISDAAKGKYDGFLFPTFKEDSTPNELLLSELTDYLKSQPYKTMQITNSWQGEVKKTAEEMKFFSAKNGIIQYIIGTIIVFCFSLALFPFVAVFILIEAVILAFVFPDALPNRTKKGAEHYAKWMNLKKFLEDFSNLKNMPPTAIVLWEKYLVYSIPLGVAKKVENAMNHVFKNYKGEYNGAIFMAGSHSFSASNFASTMSNFSTAFSSATTTSGSGGFGGGGGSGGGGGGGGAG